MRRVLLLSCIFLSGVSGLVYEILWARSLTLSFGHTVWAISTVLAVFMGGLAAGSRLLGKAADRAADPVRFYAALEAGIGIYCLFAPYLLEQARLAHQALLSSAADPVLPRTALRFVLSALVLAVPTTLMGGTVPAMSRAVRVSPGDGGSRFGLMYGLNTLGGALGAFLAGYLLLPALGMEAANRIAAGLNLAVAAAAFLAGGSSLPPVEAAPAADPAPHSGEPGEGNAAVPPKLLSLAFFLTGAAAMVFQVAWCRALVLVIGSSTYAYSAVLVTFLLGIALGGILFRRFRSPGPGTAACLLGGIGASALSSLPFFEYLPLPFLALFGESGGGFAYIQLIGFAVVSLVVFVPATLMGMAFPSLIGMALRDARKVGADVGNRYALNTVGAIAGSLLAGFVLIPAVGAQRSIAGGIAIEAGLAASFAAVARPALRRPAALAALLSVAAAFALPAWDPGVMNSAVSVFISQSGPRDYYGVSRMRSRYLLFGRDGVSSTVAVFGEAGGERWFTVNGKTDGGTGDLTPQVRLGMVPMLLNPAARRVAVVGLGTGVTAGTAGMFHGVESIDIVEIEPAVLEASRYFDAENAGILLDPRTRVHVDDGRSFLESRRASFDVVVSEPSNPWVAGVSNLYTAEFFRGVRGSLRPGGVFGQWVQIYNLSPESYRVIVRTFLDAFPDASLWQVGAGDTILIGRTGGGTLDPEAIRSRVRSSTALVERLGTNGDVPLGPLYESFLLGAGDLRTFAGGGPRNTDDLNRLEFDSPKSLYRQEIEPLLREIGRHRTRPSPDFLRLPGGEPGSPRTRSLP